MTMKLPQLPQLFLSRGRPRKGQTITLKGVETSPTCQSGGYKMCLLTAAGIWNDKGLLKLTKMSGNTCSFVCVSESVSSCASDWLLVPAFVCVSLQSEAHLAGTPKAWQLEMGSKLLLG